jgi:single-stranded-DNA-specific exonuclease
MHIKTDNYSGRPTLRGRRLKWRNGPFHAHDPLAAWHGLLELRGIDAESGFFAPRLADLPDPDDMRDMVRAAERLTQAIIDHEAVHIFGDFDCDGVCGAAILADFLRQVGLQVSVSIPHRANDGHGIDRRNIEEAHAAGARLGISVDTGISDGLAAKQAKRLGFDLIITDHHLPGEYLPEAYTILNPSRSDCGFAEGLLCGSGVAFFLLMSTWRRLRETGVRTPDLRSALDRVAIATVADVMSLTGVNRILVHHGLKQLNASPSAGIAALLKKGRRNGLITVQDIGFQIAPRINAAGRMDHGKQAMRLLCCQDAHEAESLAGELDELNRQRQAVERKTLSMVETKLKEQASDALAVYDPSWHAGVVGLVAGRLSRKYGRPAAIGFVEPDGNIRVSLRGAGGFHVGNLLEACAQYLVNYGGHAGAGGATLRPELWGDFVRALDRAIREQTSSPSSFCERLQIDGVLGPAAIHAGLVERLQWLQPFGEGNPESMWCIEGMKIIHRQDMRGNAIRLLLMSGPVRLHAVVFGASDIESHLLPGAERLFVGHLRFDDFRGDGRIQLIVEDVI